MNTVIIDGSNLLFRTYWIAETREHLINTKNVWTGPTYLFLKSVKSIASKFDSDNIWITWDKKRKYPSTNFRKQLAPETYKQNRDNEKTLKVHEQYDLINPFLVSLGIKQLYPGVLEADDIISWLCREKTISNVIISVDKDLLQLVDANTTYYNPIKKKLITQENFKQEVGVEVNEFIYFKALLGDKSDNVKGIDGYGIQKSSKLAKEGYDKIMSVLSESDQKTFNNNLTLINLFGSYNKEEGEQESYEEQYKEQLSLRSDIKAFEKLCYEFEFYSITKELDKWKEIFTRKNTLQGLIQLLT